MEAVSIARHLRMPTPRHPLGPADIVVHFFPFYKMPLLISHIHPKFAIFELGRQISALPMDLKIKLIDATPILCPIFDICRAWSESPPAEFLADTAFNLHPDYEAYDEDSGEDCSDAGTIARRIVFTRKSRPSGKTKGRTRCARRDCVSFSDRSLRVKEWVDKTQKALEVHPEHASSPHLSDSPLHSPSIDNEATSPCLADECPSDSNIRVDVSDAQTLFEIESCGHKRLLDGKNPFSKKQKISVDEIRSEGPHCVNS